MACTRAEDAVEQREPAAEREPDVAEAFRLDGAQRLVVRGLDRAELAVTEIRNERQNFGMTDPLPYVDGTMLGIQLKALPHHELWFDGKPVEVSDVAPGDTIFYDLRRDPRAYVIDPSHSLHLNLTRRFMSEIAADLGGPAFDELTVPSGTPQRDAVLRRFGSTLLPLLGAPAEVSALFSSHLMLALGIYVGTAFAGLSQQGEAGTLGRAEVRLAQEMIRADLAGATEIRALAGACRMPASRFAVGFRNATGMSPYQWMAARRLELARTLLARTKHSLARVASLCGYADARHLSREFQAATGVSPSHYRAKL